MPLYPLEYFMSVPSVYTRNFRLTDYFLLDYFYLKGIHFLCSETAVTKSNAQQAKMIKRFPLKMHS